MKRKKIGLLLAVLVVISALSIYLSWYQVEIYAPPSSIYGDKYNYRLSYSEAKKYLEFFNNATFYDMAFPESGEITDEDNHFFRIEISVGFKKQTYYFHHYINMIYKYAEDGHSRECYYYDWFSDFFIYHLELDRKYNGLIQQEGKEEWWKQLEHDPYTQYWHNSWCGWYDHWGTVYANGHMPLNEVVENLQYSYINLGYSSPFENYDYDNEMLWDIYQKVNPDTDIFTYNGLEIMYVNGNCALNSNFVVRAVDYVRKPMN